MITNQQPLLLSNQPIRFDSCGCQCSKCLCNDLLSNLALNDSNSNLTMEVELESCCSPSSKRAEVSSSSSAACACSSNNKSCCAISSLFSYLDFKMFVPKLANSHVEGLESDLLKINQIISVETDTVNRTVLIHTNSERSIFSILSVFNRHHLQVAAVQSQNCPTPISSLDDIETDEYDEIYNEKELKQQFSQENIELPSSADEVYSSDEESNDRIFQLSGMLCEVGCAQRISTTLLENKNVRHAKINFTSQTLRVRGTISDRLVIKTVQRMGFKCTKLSSKDHVPLISPILKEEDPSNGSCPVPPKQMISSGDQEYVMHSIEMDDMSIPKPINIKIQQAPTSKPLQVSIGVYGMTCASCVAMIEYALKETPGVLECSVNLLAERAEITYQPEITKVPDIIASMELLGYECKLLQTSTPGTFYLSISEANNKSDGEIAKVIESITGVTSVKYRLAGASLVASNGDDDPELATIEPGVFKIEGDATLVGPRTVIRHLESTSQVVSQLFNPDAGDAKDSLLRKREIEKWRRLFIFSIVFTAPLIVVAMILVPSKVMFLMEHIHPNVALTWESLITFVLATPVQFVSGLTFYRAAFAALRNFHGNMDLLVAVGSTLAYAYSIISIALKIENPEFDGMHFFETSASLITFIILGRWLENIAKGHTSSAIVKLMNLQSKESVLVTCKKDDHGNFQVLSEEIIPSDLVQYGDVLKVVPGASVPTDGVVVHGNSSIDESMLTGESIPVSKKPGDNVTGGTVNLEGVVYVSANKVGSESTLSQIISLVQQAQTSKAPIQALADKISKVFVPLILILGIITFVIWISLGETNSYPAHWRQGGTNPFVFAFLSSIAVVVIACPCALGLATPTAVMVGTGVGAQMGILIKGGKALETAHKTSAVLFDKTGTITTGKMTVTDYKITNSIDQATFFNVVGAAESGSEHPIGRAIVKYCTEQLQNGREEDNIQFPVVQDFKGVPGRGLTCVLGADQILIGNLAFMKENNVQVDQSFVDQAQSMETNGKTVIYVMFRSSFAGIMAISDVPREDSALAIRRLHALGLKCYMVTGDNHRAAKFIASQVGIPEENIFSEVIPKEKADKVRQLQDAKHVVCFVGDGINDSPALSQADVAVSVATGTDIAIESSSIVLLKNSLTDVHRSIHLSRVVFRRIRINFTLALVYNCTAVPLAAGIFLLMFGVSLPPMAAAAAMVVSSLSVLSSSLLLKLYRPPSSK